MLYRSLARLLDSGLPPDTLYSMLGKGFRSTAILAVVTACREAALQGRPLSEGLRASAPEIPPLHALAVGAAETSGTVPATLRDLAEADEERVRARRGLLSSALYPLLLVHLAVIAPNAGLLITEPAAFLARVLPILLAVDAALLVSWRATLRPPQGAVGELLLRLPLVGELIRASSYRSYFRGLAALYEAGVPIAGAAREAIVTIGAPPLRAAVSSALAPVDRHEPLAEAWPGFPGLRSEVMATLATSEPAGELGDALGRAARTYAEVESTLRARLVKTAGAVLYASAVAYVVLRVLGFYSDYYGRLGGL